MKVIAVVAVIVGLAASAVAYGAAPQKKLEVIEVTRAFHGAGGLDENFQTMPKPGQGFVIESDLYRWRGLKRGTHVGTLQAFCTYIGFTGRNGSLVCTGGMTLPAGKITVAGAIRQSDLFEIPIVGGSGAYAGAQGYVRVRSISQNVSADTIVFTG